jgi:2-haloacid dehalogenase
MQRRTFLALAAAACARTSRSTPARPGIRAVAFDLFTVFDPRSIDAAVAAEVPEGDKLAQLWKLRAFEYCWLRAAGEHYARFDQIVDDALVHACAARGVTLRPEQRRRLIAAWTELAPWPDSEQVLARLRDRGVALAPLANFAPAMIEALLVRAKLRGYFAHIFSTDLAHSYKPSPRAYRLAADGFGLPVDAVAFSAFGGWDAAGAAWFGYPTFWVNRLGVAADTLAPPTATGPDLVALEAWLA